MANGFKYNTSAETNVLKKGNFWISTGAVDNGPSSGYWNGYVPPTSGYTIYLNKASNGPSIYVATGDTQLITLTNQIAGTNYTGVSQCFTYFAGQSDKMVVNIDYPNIVQNGLVLNLDAGYLPSYPQSGTSWYDLGPTGVTTSLINGPTFNSNNGGAVVLDGIDDYIKIPNSIPSMTAVTMIFWVNTSYTNFYLNVCSRNNNTVTGTATGVGYGPISNSGWVQLGYMGDGTSNYFIVNGVMYNANTGGYFPYDAANSIVIFSMNNNGDFAGNSAPVTSLALNSSVYLGGYQWLDRSNKLLGILSTSANRRPYTGQISNGMFYNRVLTQSEITQNYEALGTRYTSLSVQYLVVAGGGGGGMGGGGAGGYLESTTTSLTTNTNYTVTVGGGGPGFTSGASGNGTKGSNSVFGSVTATGGGYGGSGGANSQNGGSGGSGGGGGGYSGGQGGAGNTPATSPSQGNNGGAGNNVVGQGSGWVGGGGGGAGGVGGDFSGATSGNGGIGTSSSITGSAVSRAGGGAGGGNSGSRGTATSGGGNANTNGTVNTGGGAGGRDWGNPGGSGGSGIVVLKIPDVYNAIFSGGVTYTKSTAVSGYKIYIVTATSTTSETVSFY